MVVKINNYNVLLCVSMYHTNKVSTVVSRVEVRCSCMKNEGGGREEGIDQTYQTK